MTWGEPETGWAAGDRSVLWLWTGLGGLGIVRTRKRPVPSAAPACALNPAALLSQPAPPRQPRPAPPECLSVGSLPL